MDAPELDAALWSGELDVTLYHHKPGRPIRTVPLDIEVYTTGLVAADRVPLELITRMRDAFVAGYDLQREQPEPGIAAFRRRFPDISEDHIRANWSPFEPYAFDGERPGVMDADRWRATIDYTARAHRLAVLQGERLYRPELLAPTVELAPA